MPSNFAYLQPVCSLRRGKVRQCYSTSNTRSPWQVSRRAFCTATILTLSQVSFSQCANADSLTEVQIEEIASGNGPSASPGSRVSVRWVLRRSNGYYVSSNSGFNNRFDELTYTVGTGAVIAGFEQGMIGIKAGGRRRFIVPASLGYVKGVQVGAPGPIPDDSGERRALKAHSREKLYFEVLCTKVRTQ